MVPNSENKVENQETKSWLLTLPGIFTATAATATEPTLPGSAPTIRLPGADSQGWLDQSAARCRDQHRAVAIGLTEEKSKVVVCLAGSGDLYFRAYIEEGPASRGIDLPGAIPNEGGFDVTTTDLEGSMWERQIRKDGLTILKDGAVVQVVKWRAYASL